MEIDITEFFYSECPSDFSASVAEIGRDAARDTWQAANEVAEDYNFVNDQNRDAIIDHFNSMGFSESEDMKHWLDSEINALLIQDISFVMRDYLGCFGRISGIS